MEWLSFILGVGIGFAACLILIMILAMFHANNEIEERIKEMAEIAEKDVKNEYVKRGL
jgi:predicted small secreted protein